MNPRIGLLILSLLIWMGGSARAVILNPDKTSPTSSNTVQAVTKGGTGLIQTPTDGQLLIGNTAIHGYGLATLTAGPGISISVGPSSILIGNTAISSDINTTGNATAAQFLASGTGADILPAGTTGQRPSTPVNGMIRYNSSTPGFEGYTNGSWGNIGGSVNIGGTIGGGTVLDILFVNTNSTIAQISPNSLHGVPSGQWSGVYIFGDASSYNDQYAPPTNGYGALIAKQLGAAPVYKVINDFSHFDCDVVDQEIVPNVNPTSSNNPLLVWLPTPQEASFGAGGYQSHLTDDLTCHLGGLTWAAIESENKVYGQSASCVKTGSWSNDTHYTLPAGVTSHTHGDGIDCTIITKGGPIFPWFLMNGANGGTFTWQLDSGPVSANVATQGQNAFTYPIDNTKFSLGSVRIPVTTAGTHVVHFLISSSTNVANTFTLEGMGTPSGKPLSSKSPVIVTGGQIPTASYPTASAAFQAAFLAQAQQMTVDGVNVPFADVAALWNPSTDLLPSGPISSTGQGHIAQAYNAILQGSRNPNLPVDPLEFGASCNSLYFANAYVTNSYALSTTSGSPTISIAHYTFQPGVATQFGGGDVGKRICIGSGSGPSIPEIPCTYIASVNTTNNTANMGANAATTGGSHYGTMGGYPTNPADPSTARDDTTYTQVAGNAALLGSGKVAMPSNCMFSDLVMPGNIDVGGNSPGSFYLQTNQDITSVPQTTVVNCGVNGGPNDVQDCIRDVPHTRFHDLMIRMPTFPYVYNFQITAACFGHSTQSGGPGSQVVTDNLSFFGCPVDIGQAYGYNQAVGFTAAVTNNGDGTSNMTVSAITTTNFSAAADGWGFDMLAIGRPVTGTSVPANTSILTAPPGGTTGVYTLNKGFAVSSEAMTSAATGSVTELRDNRSQHIVGGIGYNGQFTDTIITNSTCTGTFMSECLRMGPFLVGNLGCGARWIGGRQEEMQVAATTVDGCGVDLSAVDFQYNGGYNIRTMGTNPVVQMTGGTLQAGGHGSSFHNSSIRLGGVNPIVSIDGVGLSSADYGSGNGGSTTYLFATESGATLTNANISVTGGPTWTSNSTAGNMTNLYDWTNGTPGKYKQNTAGWPVIDTSVPFAATGCSATSPHGGIDSGDVTSGSTSTCTITLTMAAVPTGWNCEATDITSGVKLIQTASTTTTCALTGAMTSGDKITVSGKPH